MSSKCLLSRGSRWGESTKRNAAWRTRCPGENTGKPIETYYFPVNYSLAVTKANTKRKTFAALSVYRSVATLLAEQSSQGRYLVSNLSSSRPDEDFQCVAQCVNLKLITSSVGGAT